MNRPQSVRLVGSAEGAGAEGGVDDKEAPFAPRAASDGTRTQPLWLRGVGQAVAAVLPRRGGVVAPASSATARHGKWRRRCEEAWGGPMPLWEEPQGTQLPGYPHVSVGALLALPVGPAATALRAKCARLVALLDETPFHQAVVFCNHRERCVGC